jgi:hypothetical protein
MAPAPLPAFRHKTILQLVAEGRTDDAVDYLESVSAGFAVILRDIPRKHTPLSRLHARMGQLSDSALGYSSYRPSPRYEMDVDGHQQTVVEYNCNNDPANRQDLSPFLSPLFRGGKKIA